MKLSVIIPVYNEESTVATVLDRVLRVRGIELEVLVVDDGSTDHTSNKLRNYRSHPQISILRHRRNCGKGAAFKTALKHVSGDLILIQDADLEYSPSDYHTLLAPLINGHADAVFGSRILGGMRGHYHAYYYGGRLVTLVGNLLFGTHLTDVTTCYKVMRTQDVRLFSLRSSGFALCAELFANLACRKLRITEVPISYHARTFRDGKKISARSGFQLLGAMLKVRFLNRLYTGRSFPIQRTDTILLSGHPFRS